MSEVNHGPLPSGGFWAGFCSNPDCNVLGCPGDCGVSATQPPPEVSAGADVVAVLAEVLSAIGTYDPLMFTDQHRALFERAAEKAEAPPETGPHSQPPKRLGGYEDCSTTDGFDVAAVLARLVEEMQERERQCNDSDSVHLWHRAAGIEEARAIVEAAQATTGARAAGGENPWTAQSEDLLPCVDSEDDDTCGEPCGLFGDESIAHCVGPPGHLDGADNRWHSPWEFDFAASAPGVAGCGGGSQVQPEPVETTSRGAPEHSGVLPERSTSSSVAPSAPGVAALLAECRRRQEFAPDTGISCDEIVRLLSPEGGQS